MAALRVKRGRGGARGALSWQQNRNVDPTTFFTSSHPRKTDPNQLFHLFPPPQKDGGLTTNFWISLLLTFFAWIPGQLFAAWHVFFR